MKKIFKLRSIIFSMLAMSLVMGMSSISVSATSTSNPSEVVSTASVYANSYPYPSNTQSLSVSSTTWKTIASSTTGFNCDVVINGLVIGNYCLDVRMLDKNGNVVWSEENSVNTLNGARTFWCGKNVYTIQVKGHNGNGIAWAYQT